ncbi:amidohydrolase [Brachybacterium sp. p3-SID1565]|uniref:Amidohydrolase n=1 Tax=Brachybacterium epidermidis TaxID=2781983 RepID=A0ABR9VYA8_9MICO|nr:MULTISPECIES: amidohydrolase [Brachybacterium]MBE9403174.1 amidohydrolase [Brachybacterium epidermidis]MCT1385743.1 amidohydrolase [Brachybacterium sp. p3-SID1565]
MSQLSDAMLETLETIDSWQEPLLKDLHQHPELSMVEERTRALVAQHLTDFGYEVHELGGGVVGVLENGEGRTVLHRADMDALPIREDSGLPYASTDTQEDLTGVVQPVMHACGHDFHVATGLGAAKLLAEHRQEWSGTVLMLFQPGEEFGDGAQTMVEDGLMDALPRPEVCLSQHVLTEPVSGKVAVAEGPVLSTSQSMTVEVFGSGSHGSMPHLGVDPVVLAAKIVTSLQTLVSRELSPQEFGVVTVGSLHAGSSPNVIPETATLQLNFRAYSEEVLQRLVEGMERIVRAECQAARSPREPRFETISQYPVTDNDPAVAAAVRDALVAHFGEDRVEQMDPATASEDFSLIPEAFGVPYCYWGFGGYAEGSEVLPNHSPHWAPDLQPTLRTGTEAAAAVILGLLADEV